jgi:hypothetical protein
LEKTPLAVPAGLAVPSKKFYESLLPKKRYTIQSRTAPIIGATQKSQSCEIAHPPPYSATPILRAGFTEVLVIGILTR